MSPVADNPVADKQVRAPAKPLALVAALAQNRVIGIDNRLPWHLPDDLQHFKQLTLDQAILMGRKTWESLPGLLPRRRHIVISRNPAYRAEGAEVVDSLEAAIAIVDADQQAFLVGGAQLYQQGLPVADTLYLTEVQAEPEGDAFFPAWDKSAWQEVSREHHLADARHKFGFDFVTYRRRDTGEAAG